MAQVFKIVDYIEERIHLFSCNKNGFKTIESLYRRFNLSSIIEAVDISASQYLKYDCDGELEKESVWCHTIRTHNASVIQNIKRIQ